MKTNRLILSGFSLLCLVNLICFFPDALMPNATTAVFRTYNSFHLTSAIIAAILWAPTALKAKPRIIKIASFIGHVCCIIGIILILVNRSETTASAVGVLLGIGMAPFYSIWFGFFAFAQKEGADVALFVGIPSALAGIIFVIIRAFFPPLLTPLALIALPISCILVVFVWKNTETFSPSTTHQETNQEMQNHSSTVTAANSVSLHGQVGSMTSIHEALSSAASIHETLDSASIHDTADSASFLDTSERDNASSKSKIATILKTCVCPSISLILIALFFGMFCGIAMEDSGSPYGRYASSLGAPIGAIAFLVWSYLSKRRSYTLATEIILAAVAAIIPFVPFDMSLFSLSFCLQGCRLLLYSLYVQEFHKDPRMVMCLIGLMSGCLQYCIYLGLYIPSVFGIQSYTQFIVANPLLFLIVYAACAGLLIIAIWHDQIQRREIKHMEEQLARQNEERNELAQSILEKNDEEYAMACRLVASEYGLTKRESEIMSLLARGRDANHICDMLCLSRNTVKSYTKCIYAKLGVHSKQDVIDMVEVASVSNNRQKSKGNANETARDWK